LGESGLSREVEVNREVREFIVKLYAPKSNLASMGEAEAWLDASSLCYELYIGGEFEFGRQGYDPQQKGFSIVTWRPAWIS